MWILAVDDDPVILEILAQTLTAEDGFQLAVYPCAESALEELNTAERPFDCILLDIMLPGMDGIEMCEMLRKTKRHNTTPILMITGSQEIDLMTRAFAVGATDFITKPLKALELRTRINSASLLNQSLAQAQHTLSELTQLVKIKFEEPLALQVSGMTEALALENELLRYQAGCFAMTIFTIDVLELRGIYRSVGPLNYRRCLEAIGEAAMQSIKDHRTRLAYLGRGRFVGAVLERARIDCDVMADTVNKVLAENWDSTKHGIPVPPLVRISNGSKQRFWSSTSASETLRKFQAHYDGLGDLTLLDENDLFAKFSRKLPHAS